MKRIAFALIIYALSGASNAWAQLSSVSNYEAALQMVRNAEYVKALKTFKQLAKQGHAPSEFSIGLIYHFGRGVPKNLKLAYAWYKKALLKDHSPALNNVGMMYSIGDYVVQDRDVAFRLFKRASIKHAHAMDNLGRCYENGWGTPRNINRALEMYTLAGDNGYILGWHHVGQIYEKGYPGTPKNVDTAVEWYIKAAERKLKKSRNRLNRLGRLPTRLAE